MLFIEIPISVNGADFCRKTFLLNKNLILELVHNNKKNAKA